MAWIALKDVLKRAATTRSNFDWSKYISPPVSAIGQQKTGDGVWILQKAGLSNLTTIPLNPYIPEQSDCTFGCSGHLCDGADGCAPNLICKNSICQKNAESQPGQIGDRCTSKQLCQEHLHCSKGKCEECSVRWTIQPAQPRRQRTIPGEVVPDESERIRIVANDPDGTCYTDDIQSLFEVSRKLFTGLRPPICLTPTGRGNPCESAIHCNADSYCSWGLCTLCTSKDACLGSPCRSNNKCKTGYCNDHGRCDYPGLKKSIIGPGRTNQSRNVRMGGIPKGHERGPVRGANTQHSRKS